MVFSSLTFLVYFLPVTLLGNYILPDNAKNYWLLAMSLLFYAWGAHGFVLVMIASILCNYIFALLIDRSASPLCRKGFLIAAVAVNLGILFYNKYMNFFTQNLHKIFGDSVTVTKIILPIGISFFTFQAMSYVIDVYRGKAPVQRNPYHLGLYISFFPQLIAGPIVRYNTIEKQIERRPFAPPAEMFCDGVSRFMSGFIQKIFLANNMSVIADAAFSLAAKPQQLSVAFAWLGAACYALQIYFDFCGYSSMAIGLGKMFGFQFMENFNYPYISGTVTEFWRRWHISLSQWFRDYVYIPLGGNRCGAACSVVNLFIVWLLTGIWHGANWTFIVWGMIYFVLLVFERLSGLAKKQLPPLSRAIYRVFCLVSVVLAWVVFRCGHLSHAAGYYAAMAGLAGNPFWDNNALRYLNDYKILLTIAVICATPALSRLKDFLSRVLRSGNLVSAAFDLCALAMMAVSISYLVMGANNPFIYFNF